MTTPSGVQVELSPVFNGMTFLNSNGKPLVNGEIWQYQAGSFSNQQTTYADYEGTIPNPNPIILDSSGRSTVQIWLKHGSAYNLQVVDALTNVPQYTEENITGTVSGGGGGGGVAFPLLRTDFSDTTNTNIMWVNDLSDYPEEGDSRIRGTYNDWFGDAQYQTSDVWFDAGDGFGYNWTPAWSVFKLPNYSCCGGFQYSVGMRIPNLVVDNLTGVDFVSSITAFNGLTASSESGIVSVGKQNALEIFNDGWTVQGSQVRLGSGYYVNQATGNPQQYKVVVNGVYTAGSDAETTNFTLTWGYGNDKSYDVTIASMTVTGATGTSVPFRAEFFVQALINPGTGLTNIQKTNMSIHNQGSTGISTQPWTGSSSPATGSFNATYGGWLNMYAQTSASDAIMTVSSLTFEEQI